MSNIGHTKEEIFNFLKGESLMALSTVSAEKTPHTTMMLYSIDENWKVSFVTHSDSQKAKNLEHNKKVSFVIWEPQKMSLQIDGEARMVSDPTEQDAILEGIAKSATHEKNFWPPIIRIRGAEYIVFTVDISRVRCLDLTSDKINERESPFTEINF